MKGKLKYGEDADLKKKSTALAPCEMARVGKEKTYSDNVLSTMFPSLATPHEHPITKENKVVVVALSLSATKDAKINVPAEESNASMLITQCTLPTALVDPTKFIPHIFPELSPMSPRAQVLDVALRETRGKIEDSTAGIRE